MPAPETPLEVLEQAVAAYYDAAGNKAEAARKLGLRRQTYNDRLKAAERRLGFRLGKVADGRIKLPQSVRRRLPKKGSLKRYLITSIQNNTHLHPCWENIVALHEFLDGLYDSSCELIVGTYSYQKATYGPKAVKRGKHKPQQYEDLWYDPKAEPYILDESVELAPGLVWCGEQNILPTAKRPLSDFETYNGRKSNVVPHARIQMESVASMADEATKLNFSTGTVTQMNYIQKRAGILAEQRHDYGCLLVEVDHNGAWWVRQLFVGEDGSIMDLGPSELEWVGLIVEDGQVREKRTVAALSWGDAHSSEMDLWVRELAWGEGGMLDVHRPRYQFMHDLFSMRSRSPHEEKNFHRTFEKIIDGEEIVEEEVQVTADFLAEAARKDTETIVIPSNHDEHLRRWLNDADFRRDPHNARYFCWLQHALLSALEAGDKDFNVLEWALDEKWQHSDHDGTMDEWGITFLAQDESFVLLGVEHGLHGDLGPNGGRGSTKGLTKMGRGITKGHDHTAAILDKVFSGGACAARFPYMRGPSSHSISHVALYENGTRCVVTMYGGKWRG